MTHKPIEHWPLAQWRVLDIEYCVDAINEGRGLVVVVTATGSGDRRTTVACKVPNTADLAAEMIRWHRGTDDERTRAAERLLAGGGLDSTSR